MADGLNVRGQQAKEHPAGAIPEGLNTTITSLDVRSHCELSRVTDPAHSAPIRPKTDQKTPSLTIKTCLLLLHGNTSPFIVSTGNIQQVLICIRCKMQLGASTNKAHSLHPQNMPSLRCCFVLVCAWRHSREEICSLHPYQGGGSNYREHLHVEHVRSGGETSLSGHKQPAHARA